MHQPTSCTLSMFQSLSMLWPVRLKNLVGKESSDQWQEESLASSFAAYLHELSRWPQHYENDVTAWSFQTLAFAVIWNCWKRAPLLKCSDTVCLSSIKTSKRSGTSETCTVWVSLRRLTFHDPGPRWNHQSSTYLSNTLDLNFPQYYPIVYISATFSNIDVVYELTEVPCLERHSCLHSSSNCQERETLADQNRKPQGTKFELLHVTRLSIQHGTTCANSRTLSFASWQEVLHPSEEPWLVASVPSYCMLGVLSDNSTPRLSAQQIWKITEAAFLDGSLKNRLHWIAHWYRLETNRSHFLKSKRSLHPFTHNLYDSGHPWVPPIQTFSLLRMDLLHTHGGGAHGGGGWVEPIILCWETKDWCQQMHLLPQCCQDTGSARQDTVKTEEPEAWGFAGSLGCLQRRSYATTNLIYFVHVPISQHAVTRSPQKPCR